MRVIGIIPARFGSTRFPGKPLAEICGKPMVWHVWNRAREALPSVYVATDDSRIAATCKDYGIPSVMTRREHRTGTDRVAEAASHFDADIVVNIQGDEPIVSRDAILALVAVLNDWPDISAANAYTDATEDEARSVNVVKAAIARDGRALCFSRLPIPYGASRHLKQLGLYAFTREALDVFRRCAPGKIEAAESVEMMRLVEAGHRVHMVRVGAGSIAVDTLEDLERVRSLMAVAA